MKTKLEETAAEMTYTRVPQFEVTGFATAMREYPIAPYMSLRGISNFCRSIEKKTRIERRLVHTLACGHIAYIDNKAQLKCKKRGCYDCYFKSVDLDDAGGTAYGYDISPDVSEWDILK